VPALQTCVIMLENNVECRTSALHHSLKY